MITGKLEGQGEEGRGLKRDLNIYVVDDEIFLLILFVGPT